MFIVLLIRKPCGRIYKSSSDASKAVTSRRLPILAKELLGLSFWGAAMFSCAH